jgi:hypothetical protein
VAAGRLSIGAFEITALVPRDQRPLPWLTGDLIELVPRLVVPRLAAALGPELPEGDGSVWLIRELTIDLAVAARWSADQIAERIAAAIIAAIQRVLRGAAGPGVVRLPDRAEHVASVLRDVVVGGGPRWQHGGWAGAAARPRAEAIAALLRDAGDDGPAALIRLGGTMAAQIVALLDDRVVAVLARAWGVIGPMAASRPDPAAGAVVQDAARRLPRGWLADRPRAALLLLALTGETLARPKVPAMAAAVRSVLFGADPAGDVWRPLTRDAADPPDDGSGATARDDGRSTSREAGSAKAVRRPRDAASFATLTTNAGLFLLWRSAIESGALGHASSLAGDAAGAAALARALAGGTEDPVLDPAVQCLLRLADEDIPPAPAALTLPALLAVMASDDWRKPAVTHAVLEIASISADAAAGGRVAILADAATATWLWLWPGAPPPGDELLGRLGAGAALLVDTALAEELAATWPGEPADEGRLWLLPPGARAPVSPPPLRHQPGRLARDLATVCHPVTRNGRRGVDAAPGSAEQARQAASDDLLWACLGQRVFRDLARRLPGFIHASPDWLRANILPRAASATLSATPDGDELTVTADPPPLAMLTRIAGLLPGRYRVPGEPHLTVALQLAKR